MKRVRLTITLLLTLFVAATTSACDSITGDDDITGTYTLQTVNGQPLPFVEYEDADWRDEITALSITLNEGTSCSITASWRVTDKGTNEVTTDTESETCTYEVTGSTLKLTTPDEADFLTGTLDGDTLTITEDGDTFVLKK